MEDLKVSRRRWRKTMTAFADMLSGNEEFSALATFSVNTLEKSIVFVLVSPIKKKSRWRETVLNG